MNTTAGSGLDRSSDVIRLPPAETAGGMPLMQALKHRRSSREFGVTKLPLSLLSNLLWAAFGINRPAEGGRTAPSAHDWEEMDVYVASEEGVYRYDAGAQVLHRVLGEDIREATGLQDYVGHAPVNLLYVADLSRMESATAKEKAQYAGPDAGFIAENVYLFCASAGLATVVRGLVDRKALAKRLKLKPDQEIVLAQSVGYPSGTH